jgi:hypothetical protein
MAHVYDVLRDNDNRDGSWTNEDPSRDSLPAINEFTSSGVQGEFLSFTNSVKAINKTSISTPLVKTAQSVEPLQPAVASFLLDSAGKEMNVVFASKQILSKVSALVTYLDRDWVLTASQFDEKQPTLESTVFNIEPAKAVHESTVFEQSLHSSNAPAIVSAMSTGFKITRLTTSVR